MNFWTIPKVKKILPRNLYKNWSIQISTLLLPEEPSPISSFISSINIKLWLSGSSPNSNSEESPEPSEPPSSPNYRPPPLRKLEPPMMLELKKLPPKKWSCSREIPMTANCQQLCLEAAPPISLRILKGLLMMEFMSLGLWSGTPILFPEEEAPKPYQSFYTDLEHKTWKRK